MTVTFSDDLFVKKGKTVFDKNQTHKGICSDTDAVLFDIMYEHILLQLHVELVSFLPRACYFGLKV